jgi:hypothetical protein
MAKTGRNGVYRPKDNGGFTRGREGREEKLQKTCFCSFRVLRAFARVKKAN